MCLRSLTSSRWELSLASLPSDFFSVFLFLFVRNAVFSGAEHFCRFRPGPALQQPLTYLVQVVSQHAKTYIALEPVQAFVRAAIQTVMLQSVDVRFNGVVLAT